MAKTKCPHCGGEYETTKDVLDAINLACASSTAADPESVSNGYHLWFHGYMITPNMIDLVGMVVASPPDSYPERLGYVVIVVHDGFDLSVQSFHKGDALDISYRLGWISETVLERPDAIDILLTAKQRAMQFLKEHIENLPVLDSPQPEEENTIGN